MILKAVKFATIAHHGQTRKYTGEPYILHSLSVAEIVEKVGDEQMVVAAILHDTVEDTDVTLEDIRVLFGTRIAHYVDGLTDVSVPEDGNREQRRKIDVEHTATIHPKAQTIKLADILHNTSNIALCDPKFAEQYMREKWDTVAVLTDGHPALFGQANSQIREYFDKENK